MIVCEEQVISKKRLGWKHGNTPERFLSFQYSATNYQLLVFIIIAIIIAPSLSIPQSVNLHPKPGKLPQ